MNLRKRISGASDFDVLSSDTGLKISGESEGDMLVLGAFYSIVITILPQEGRIRAEVYFRDVRQVMSFELPLGLAREMSIPLEWSLGILRKMEGIEISIPLMRLVEQTLEIVMPLKIKPLKLRILVEESGKARFGIEYIGKIGKGKRKTIKTLKELREVLKED